MRHRFIDPIDCQRVLDQVIGADGQKVKILEKHIDHERRSRHLDHGPHLDRAVGLPLGVQLAPRTVDQCQRLPDLAHVRKHRHQQVNRPMDSGPQDGAQLCQEHGRLGQAPAYRPQTQSRVEMVFRIAAAVQRFVSAHIDGADGDRQALHALHRRTVGPVLLFFIGQAALAPHEQKLTAEQPHTDGPRLERAGTV